FPEEWVNKNPDGLFAWEIDDVPIGSTANKALKMNFYDYEDSEGELDLVITPLIDLSDVPLALLMFDVSYARYKTSNDGLRVVLLSECNTTISEGVILYDKSGSALATTDDSNIAYRPTSANQWRTEGIDLAEYIGQKVQFAF